MCRQLLPGETQTNSKAVNHFRCTLLDVLCNTRAACEQVECRLNPPLHCHVLARQCDSTPFFMTHAVHGTRFEGLRLMAPYHGGRQPSSDDSFHSLTVIPSSALDKPIITKYVPSSANNGVRCDCTIADDGKASWYSVCPSSLDGLRTLWYRPLVRTSFCLSVHWGEMKSIIALGRGNKLFANRTPQ